MAADVTDDDLHALDVGRKEADLGVHLDVDRDHFGLMCRRKRFNAFKSQDLVTSVRTLEIKQQTLAQQISS